MSKKLSIAVVVVALIIVAIIAILVTKNSPQVAGATFSDVDGVTGFTGVSITGTPGSFNVTATSTQNSYSTFINTGSCNTASSTLFVLNNPFAATSTATLEYIAGTGNATSTNLLIGTSTKTSGLVITDVSPIFASSSIATSTSFYVAGGINAGSVGQVTAGAGTLRTILVGPSTKVVAEATSTAANGGALLYTPGFTGCTYTVRWGN